MNSQIKITNNFDKVWFTADNHFGHENIIEYCNRPFKTVLEMDNRLIDNWNKLIEPGDTVYHLGDFTLSDRESARLYFGQLNGFINILSNPWHHDKRWLNGPVTNSLTIENLWSKDNVDVIKLPPMIVLEVYQYKSYPIAITLCHYPLEQWDRKHYGATHLHGHCHGKPLRQS